ncbi:SUMF1/EgtB/PvdO family nonheme iron enzyme [Roseibium aestuarii]|uniref:SUMF1/EgtB/PvdO family nonheme iron enzyme n=1 Tax=Roseibium aestuarii TaxID=2600299 RepID=A0ABW4JZR8_9HYPH|nr:SUMF1/EgtB/PvdO family nonheme iron enzyme [Roseibium aestuarii]
MRRKVALEVFALLALSAGSMAIIAAPRLSRPTSEPLAETVTIPAGEFAYRPAAKYRLYGKLIDPPLERVRAEKPLQIMRFQVSRAQYARCVLASACTAAEGMPAPTSPYSEDDPQGRLPQTGVNWYDARDFADWYSRQTGIVWRLPDDVEWQRAAVERFVDDALDVDQGLDPAQRWLAAYRRNVESRQDMVTGPQPLGAFGANSAGLMDLGGNVWEWTSSCVESVVVSADRETKLGDTSFCGAHIAEGRHRAVVVDLVRNPKVGGCAAGVPPDFVGFRLVRDE